MTLDDQLKLPGLVASAEDKPPKGIGDWPSSSRQIARLIPSAEDKPPKGIGDLTSACGQTMFRECPLRTNRRKALVTGFTRS